MSYGGDRMIKSLHEFHQQRWSITTIPHIEMLLQRNNKALHEEMTIWNSYPVYYAIICGAKLKIVVWLVEKTGKDFVRKLEFNHKWNLLHHVVYRNHPHLIPYLLDLLGTDLLKIETEDDNMFTPMEFAKDLSLKKRKKRCVELLTNPEETVKKYQERVEDEIEYMIWDLHSKQGWDESDLSYVKKIIRRTNKKLEKEFIEKKKKEEEENKRRRRLSRSRRRKSKSPSPSRRKSLRRSQSSLSNSNSSRKKSLQGRAKSMQNVKDLEEEDEKNKEKPPNILHQLGGDDDEIPIYYAIRFGGPSVDFKIYTDLCEQTGFEFCKSHKSKNGYTLMHWAVCNKTGPKLDFIEWLGKDIMGVEMVKNMRIPYIDGPYIRYHENDTLLHEAAKYQRIEIIPFLLSTLGKEALKIKNKDGLTPVEISKKRESRNLDIEDLLVYPTKTITTYEAKFKTAEVKIKAIAAFTNPFKKKKRPSIVLVPKKKEDGGDYDGGSGKDEEGKTF